jgi:hypothetical protein
MLTPPDEPKCQRNPLLWAAIGSLGTFIPPYHFRSFVDFLLPAAALLFLIFYILKSRYAWYVLAADILFVSPLYIFLSPSWRLQTFLNSRIIWVAIIGTCLVATLLFWSRGRYFAYLEQQKQHGIDERI